MGQLQPGRAVTQVTAPALSQQAARAKRRWQAWHCLIPIFTAFWLVFGVVLLSSGWIALAVSALAVLALLSTLVIALAWAFQNNL
jgi:VIT1/CCC1 family predicted Fe2+/Mn2+ transporter